MKRKTGHEHHYHCCYGHRDLQGDVGSRSRLVLRRLIIKQFTLLVNMIPVLTREREAYRSARRRCRFVRQTGQKSTRSDGITSTDTSPAGSSSRRHRALTNRFAVSCRSCAAALPLTSLAASQPVTAVFLLTPY